MTDDKRISVATDRDQLAVPRAVLEPIESRTLLSAAGNFSAMMSSAMPPHSWHAPMPAAEIHFSFNVEAFANGSSPIGAPQPAGISLASFGAQPREFTAPPYFVEFGDSATPLPRPPMHEWHDGYTRSGGAAYDGTRVVAGDMPPMFVGTWLISAAGVAGVVVISGYGELPVHVGEPRDVGHVVAPAAVNLTATPAAAQPASSAAQEIASRSVDVIDLVGRAAGSSSAVRSGAASAFAVHGQWADKPVALWMTAFDASERVALTGLKQLVGQVGAVAEALIHSSFGDGAVQATGITAALAADVAGDLASPARLFHFARFRAPLTLMADSVGTFVDESARIPVMLGQTDHRRAWLVTALAVAADTILLTYYHRATIRAYVRSRATRRRSEKSEPSQLRAHALR